MTLLGLAMFVGGLITHIGKSWEDPMLDRQKVETILMRRFPGATRDQVAISANAIMGLGEEWEELHCHDLQALAAHVAEGQELRVLRRLDLEQTPDPVGTPQGTDGSVMASRTPFSR